MPSDSPSNPFAGAMAHAQTVAKSATEDFTRMFAEMKMPATVDMETLLTAHKKNMEVLSAANRVAMEGAQALGRRNMEIMQQTMAEMGDSMRALTSTESPQEKAAKQTEMLKRAYERAVGNAKELGDLIQRSNGEAIGLLNARFTEAMEEVKALVAKGSDRGGSDKG